MNHEPSPLRVALFDYGVGNLHSLGKALEHAGADVLVTNDWTEALDRDALVLPGVGAFSAALEALPDDRSEIVERVAGGMPTLGICLGMQLLFDTSEEGEGHGLGVVPGRVRRVRATVVPQMGWNEIETGDDPLFDGTPNLVAYYANSFVCEPTDIADVIGWTEYEDDRFVAAVRRGSIVGVQCHPEKSSMAGRRVIANFIRDAEARIAADGRGDA
ncbi:MAG TPA: imidazole glycerol phosphate synthase subunit HisH [Longimicrobiales bacterium]|nr:imidazole glycerol phosphate synthase subunit HisH [Longimicrobiales bacterium]